MFSRHSDKSIVGVSAELNDEADWQAGILRPFVYHLHVCVFAFEPILGLFAVGTTTGDIDIYGAPGVHIRLSVSDQAKINLLQFSTSLSRLLCVDEHDRLHVWDLVTPGKPRLQKIINFRHPVTALTLSPSHQHVLIALANGEMQTYDLLCSRISPYRMPNLWKMYEDKMLARGATSSSADRAGALPQIPVEIMIHPRDLNLLFVAYDGGVILSDLSQRNILRVYELELPPGAPGGAGYHAPDILTHRKPPVTAFAIHPSGHLFAVGHVDGSIAFWALEDEDKPLLVRTLDEDDTHVVHADELNEMLSTAHAVGPSREPIFRLAWSGFPNSTDPRGGMTVLTVLGGLRSDEPPGVTVYALPAFNPGEPPTPVDPAGGLHPFFRTAMRASLMPSAVYTYFTKGVTQDFLLIPRASPHFSGTWDPVGILLMSEYKGDTRAIEAYDFPPPSLTSQSSPTRTGPEAPAPAADRSDVATSPIDILTDELATTLESMQLTDDPRQLRLPSPLWNGLNGILGGQLIALERDAYETFVDERELDHGPEVSLRGGVAWVEDFQGEMKLMKLQPHRILMTHHPNLSIRFQDFSSQILVSSTTSPLQRSFPHHLSALTIDLTSTLADPAIATRTSPKFIDEAQIISVHLASESLECAVVLLSGEVVLYRLIHSGGSHSLQDDELVPLQHIPAHPGYRFRPIFAVMAENGPVSSLEISDIGFIAVAYSSGLLLIIDMRGPKVLLRLSPEVKSSFLHRKEHADPFVHLTWTVSGTAADPSYRVLLIATRDSGSSTVYSIVRSQNGSWSVKDNPESTEAVSHPITGGSAIIDARNGHRCGANRNGLATIMASSPGETADHEARKTIWVSAGSKGVKCVVNVTGERVERVDWGSKAGKVERVEIVHKNAAAVLVAFTDKRQALVYSLPFLELLHTLHLDQSSSEPLLVDSTGDYIELVRHQTSGLISRAHYGTLFNIRRSAPYEPPSINLTNEKRVIPAQPQPVSIGPTSYLSSWLGYITSQGMTGEQVDALLAGPDRPVAQPTPKERVGTQDADSRSQSAVSGSMYDMYSAQAQGVAASAATTASNLYSRLGAAFAERTENLGQLQESFDSLEQGSRKMLAQSKTMAAKQTAKGWLGF